MTAVELKDAVSNGLNKLLDPIRETFEASEEWQEITKLAYPGSVQWVESLSDVSVHPMFVIAIGPPLSNLFLLVACS